MLISSLKSTYSRAKLVFGLLASVVLTGGLFLTYVQPGTIYTDGGIFSAVAFKDLHGGALYQDTWENKPPGIFYLIEFFFILVPDPVYALFVLGLLAMLCLGMGLFYLFYKYFESLAIALLCFSITLYFTVYKNNIGDGLCTEIYGTLFLVASLAFFERYRLNPKKINLAFTGLSLGFSFWFKEPFLLICIPLFIYYAFALKNKKAVIQLLIVATLPSILFFVLLSIDHSVYGFVDAFSYNFQYSSRQEDNNYREKLADYYKHLIEPILGLALLFLYLLYKNLADKKTRNESLIFFFIFIASTLFVLMAPYNLGHYYFPSFVLLFVLIAKQYAIRKAVQNAFSLPFFLVLIYYIYSIDQIARPKFTFRIIPFQADKITERLRREKNASLFVDYVSVSDYYIKSGKVHPAFLPVALPVHFDESERGKRNRARIWKELSGNPPDYLITTFTISYFSWSFPETDFYYKNYHKVDSVFPANEHVIYLWKLKKP